jgi:hypothetical protein
MNSVRVPVPVYLNFRIADTRYGTQTGVYSDQSPMEKLRNLDAKKTYQKTK